MARNTQFHPEREPMRDNASLQLDKARIRGPFSFLNPTQAHFLHVGSRKAADSQAESTAAGSAQQDGQQDGQDETRHTRKTQPASEIGYRWTSRNNRKGRHALVIKKGDINTAKYRVPQSSSSPRAILQGIWRMITYYPVWDVSYLVATVFTLGSVIWVINAFFSFYPQLVPKSMFPGEVLYGGGITAFIGATVFEIGSVLLMLEAINENRTGCFGWALEQYYEGSTGRDVENGGLTKVVPSVKECTHHHMNSKNLVGKPATKLDEKSGKLSNGNTEKSASGTRSWSWWPSAYELHTHYLHDLGFIACCSQMFGATIFWISGFTALPGIFNHMSPGLVDGIYWVPQVIGGMGFVVSGTLFMVETQKHWWLPAPRVLGWHIGLWNLIGGIGFTLCPCFGFDTAAWAQYQAGCSTFWGSWAFLIGSVIQWYESLDKHPLETEKES